MKRQKDILDLLKKAKDSLKGAEVLFREGLFDFFVSRSYYAMFYMTEGVLLTKDLAFSKHSAIIGAFGRDFVKPKILPQKLRDYLADAFDLRQLGDYGAPGIISKDKAQQLIEHAKEFIETVEAYLKKVMFNNATANARNP
ncbi:MAG: HEPN domain-containing protein [bacterium]